MTRFAGPVGLLVGVLLIVVGAVLQASGAAAVVFCSVIGAGILLAFAGVIVWLVQAFRHRAPAHPLAS